MVCTLSGDTTDDFGRGLEPVNPYTSTMRDNQFTLTWLVSPMQTNT